MNEKTRAPSRWIAACMFAVAVGAGIVTGSAVASADTASGSSGATGTSSDTLRTSVAEFNQVRSAATSEAVASVNGVKQSIQEELSKPPSSSTRELVTVAHATVSNVLKTRHDTVKNAIGNIR